MSHRVASVLLSLAVSATLCACAASKPVARDADDPSLAPRPFTAEQIRANHPDGTVLVFKIKQAGGPPIVGRVQFVSSDANGAVTEQSVVGASGEPIGEPKTSSVTWDELRGSYPAEKTRLSRAKCTVGSRVYDCQLYEVAGEEDGLLTSARYYFAPERPGSPVLVEQERDGKRFLRMELVESTQPHGA